MPVDGAGISDAWPNLTGNHFGCARQSELEGPPLGQSALKHPAEGLRLLVKVILPKPCQAPLHFADITETERLITDGNSADSFIVYKHLKKAAHGGNCARILPAGDVSQFIITSGGRPAQQCLCLPQCLRDWTVFLQRQLLFAVFFQLKPKGT